MKDKLHPPVLFKNNSFGEGGINRADKHDLEQLPLAERIDAFKQKLVEVVGDTPKGAETNQYDGIDTETFHEGGERSVAHRSDIYD